MSKIRIFPNIDKDLYKEATLAEINWSEAATIGIKILLGKNGNVQKEIARLKAKAAQYSSQAQYFAGQAAKLSEDISAGNVSSSELDNRYNTCVKTLRAAFEDGRDYVNSLKNYWYPELVKLGFTGSVNDIIEVIENGKS